MQYRYSSETRERYATITCTNSFHSSVLEGTKLECVDGHWINTDDNKAVDDAYCGPYMPSSISISDENALYIQIRLFGIEDMSACGTIVFKLIAEGKCQNHYFVDSPVNPSICACLATYNNYEYNNNLVTLSSQELSSIYNTSGYYLQMSLCPRPVLPDKAQIDDEDIVIDDDVVGLSYPKGTFSIVCNEQYRYDSGTLECDPSLISGNNPWIGDIGNCILMENCSLLLILISSVFCLYWGMFWCLSWKAYRQTRRNSVYDDMENVLQSLDLRLALGSARSIKIERGCMGELFGGEVIKPSILVPDLHGDIMRSGWKKYILDMSHGFKFSLSLNVMDFITDLLFTQSMFYTHRCIAIISGTSFMFSSVGFVLYLIVDYKAFQRGITQEDRAIVRLRWEILMLTPLEDITHGILGIYLFHHNIVDFITFLCIALSGGMIVARIFKLVIADQGGLHTIKRSRADAMQLELPEWNTPGIDDDCEDAVTIEPQTFEGTTEIEIEEEFSRCEGETYTGRGEKRFSFSAADCDDHLEGGAVPEDSVETTSPAFGEASGTKDDQVSLSMPVE